MTLVISYSCLAKVTPPRAQTLAGAADTTRPFKKSDIDNYNALFFLLQWPCAPKIAFCHKTRPHFAKNDNLFYRCHISLPLLLLFFGLCYNKIKAARGLPPMPVAGVARQYHASMLAASGAAFHKGGTECPSPSVTAKHLWCSMPSAP